jgi:hypothetical protein
MPGRVVGKVMTVCCYHQDGSQPRLLVTRTYKAAIISLISAGKNIL